jgi:hypothetical protein
MNLQAILLCRYHCSEITESCYPPLFLKLSLEKMDHGLPYGLSANILGLRKTRPSLYFSILDFWKGKWFPNENYIY